MATRCSIRRAPDLLRSLALLGEAFQQILLPTEVDLVGCTAVENGVRNLLIVVSDVERDQSPHRRGTVEDIEKEPGVL